MQTDGALHAGRCPRPRPGGGRCHSRRCPSCGLLWAGDTRIKLLANIAAYSADVALVTVTAPGADELPWDDGGCTVVPAAAARWNVTAPGRWRRLHRRAAERTGRACSRPTLVARSWEYQRRGVLHVHLVLGMGTARERHAAHNYVAELDAMRGRHGFGFVDRGKLRGPGRRHLELIAPHRAAGYLAKYLSPTLRDGKLALAETAKRADVPPNVVYVSRKLTAISGVTIRFLRARRTQHMRARAAGYRLVDALTGEVAPLRGAGVVATAPARGP